MRFNIIRKNKLFTASHGWLTSRFHFSFAEYYNPKNLKFGVLRVLNDDKVRPKSGFDMHPHKDMEIISYVINGSLTHGDSINNSETINRGHIQYMSAGRGIIHSEYNHDKNNDLTFLQIWILPAKKNLPPAYGSRRIPWEKRVNQLFHIVSGESVADVIRINQDVNIYVCDAVQTQKFNLEQGRQIYLVNIEGRLQVNDLDILEDRDAIELISAGNSETLILRPESRAHFLIIEMKEG